MQLLIIRHGESEADLLGVCEGRADFALTERGRRQAQAMAERVAGEYRVDRIYASTLIRARQTAESLSRATGAELIFDEDLMEFNNGLLAGVPFEEAAVKYPKVKGLSIYESRYGMETLYDFRHRSDRALESILSKTPETGTIAIVSHGGLIGQLYRSFLSLPVDCRISFSTGDTSIHLWKTDREGRRVVFANSLRHARDL